MKRKRQLVPLRTVLLSAGVILAIQPVIGRPYGGRLTYPQVDQAADQLMRAAQVTGVGLCVFHAGRIDYLKAYGSRDVEKALPLTPDSVMTAASLTKAAFAVLLMRLVEERVLNLDRPIDRYLPKPLEEYPRYADLRGDSRWRKMTLRILLSHTSGFPNWRAFEEDGKLHIHFSPGARYAYSGEGIDLAQFVVETVTGRSVQSLIEEKLFAPLGMAHTSMVWEPRFEENFANRYDEHGRSLGPQRRKRADAAGSMQTTLRDYSLFLSAVMQRKLLSTRTTAAMLRTQVLIHSAHQFPSLGTETTIRYQAIGLGYGLGWGVYKSPYGRGFFKEGHDEGWRHLALCLGDGSGILLMTNSSNGEGLFKPLIDAVLGATSFPFGWEDYTPYNLLPPRQTK